MVITAMAIIVTGKPRNRKYDEANVRTERNAKFKQR
jgi:hypothetical protein